jgi:hypothetical protein
MYNLMNKLLATEHMELHNVNRVFFHMLSVFVAIAPAAACSARHFQGCSAVMGVGISTNSFVGQRLFCQSECTLYANLGIPVP